MSILQRIFKSKPKTHDQLYITHQNWVFWLTGGWLLVTFEHIYYTVSQYTLDTVWMIAETEIPFSDISNFALVLLLEITLFWSVMFIPATKKLKVKKYIMYAIQGIGISISMFLNIKYMIMASPTQSTMDIAIGAVIGGLIPIFVVLFGYVEGQLVDSQTEKIDTEPAHTDDEIDNGELAKKIKAWEDKKFEEYAEKERLGDTIAPQLSDPIETQVRKFKLLNPHYSIRELAEQYNIPQEDVQKYLDEGRQYETTSNDEIIPD